MTMCPHCGQTAPTAGPVCPLCRGDLRDGPERPPGTADAAPPPGSSRGPGVRVYGHPVLANVAIVQTALESAGIASEIRGAYGRRMTHHVADVELWLEDDSQETRAREIVEVAQQAPPPLPPWTCAECGEEVEGHYAQCWSCGTEG